MIKSKEGTMLSKEEFEKLEEGWTERSKLIISLGNAVTADIMFNDEKIRSTYNSMIPLLEGSQMNAIKLILQIIKDDIFMEDEDEH